MANWRSLGKKRTRLGQAMDEHGITQQRLADEAGVGKNMVSRLANGDDSEEGRKRFVRNAIVKAMKRLTGQNYTGGDFWA